MLIIITGGIPSCIPTGRGKEPTLQPQLEVIYKKEGRAEAHL